jgi:hypothetical protein
MRFCSSIAASAVTVSCSIDGNPRDGAAGGAIVHSAGILPTAPIVASRNGYGG